MRYCEINGIEEVKDLEPGMDFRRPEYRREVFHRFYSFHLKYRSHPGCVYYLLPYITRGMGREERLWLAYLNGLTQHLPTSLIIFRRIPEPMPSPFLREFFDANFQQFGWDTDRRHWKSKFLACVDDYFDQVSMEGSQGTLFDSLTTNDPIQTFNNIWSRVRGHFHSFGRLSTFSYLEYLNIVGVEMACDRLFLEDMKGSTSHRNGIAKVCGRDDLDWHNSNPGFTGYSPRDMAWLEEEGNLLLEEAWLRNTSPDVGFFTLESALCTFKSWFRPNRRYPNCYNDMLVDRLEATAAKWPGEDLSMFWEARREFLPDHLRIELNPNDPGLDPDKQNHFRETGEVVMMWKDDPVFANSWNERVYGCT